MISELLPLATIFLILTNLVASQTAKHFCFPNGNYTSNSTYKSNLDALLSSLSTSVDDNGFYNASMGQNPDTTYANVLCRGDVQLHTCRSCIRNATIEIINSCPNYKQAVLWNELCTLRYSDESMFGINVTNETEYWGNTEKASSPVQFMADARRLVDNLSDQAANGGSLRKVAAGNRSSVDFQNIYSLVQCTPDLSPGDCSSCLIGAAVDIPIHCSSGCRVLKPSCNLRYEIYPFSNETRLQELQVLTTPSLQHPPSPSLPPGPPWPPTLTGEKDENTRPTVVIIIIVSLAAGLLLSISVGFLLRKRLTKRKSKSEELDPPADDSSTVESLQFDFAKIKAATDDFSDANKLGEGGFGIVYKGELPNGREIAVKRLSMDSTQGDLEFKNEVLLMAKLQHRNLVRLLGFSIKAKERLLVYEFVHNASLDKFIFDPTKKIFLNWELRYKIIMGIARGLVYLHEDSQLRIIHRDLKASNVLLDIEMNPKIADFGTARLFELDETRGNTSRIVGTYGYMPPEYAIRGQFSVKLDVFSFGVLILEIISGQKNNAYQSEENVNFLSWVWKYWRQGTIANMIDPILLSAGSNISLDMLRCIHIGLLCVQNNAVDRPTISSVAVMLSSVTVTIPVPSEPAFFVSSDHNDNSVGLPRISSNSLAPSQTDTLITILYPR